MIVAMDHFIRAIVLGCLFISVYSAESDSKKESTIKDNQQKREISELGNEYPGYPTHDQLAQEQNPQLEPQYQLEYQPEYSYQAEYKYQPEYKYQQVEQNSNDPPRSQNLKEIYVIPNQRKSQYIIMAPQVQVAPVQENNGEQYQEQQPRNEKSYVYYNLIPQEQHQEQNNYPHQLFYPNLNNQNSEDTYQPHEQSQSHENQKYMFIPYENEAFNFHQNEEPQQLEHIKTQSQQEKKTFLHIRLLPFYSKNTHQNQLQENEEILAKYAPQYNEHQINQGSDEHLHKIQNEKFQERLQEEAIANWQKYVQQEHQQQNEQIQYNYPKSSSLENLNLQNVEVRQKTVAIAKYAPRYQNHDSLNNNLLHQINSEKLKAHAQAEAIAKSPPVVVHKEINIIKRKPINIVNTVRVPVPTPVLIPVPQPYKQYIPQPYPVPLEIIRPVIIPIEKTEKIEVEKPVPVEVEKIVHVPVEKKVYYNVDKPFPVEKTVHVEVTKEIPVEVPVYKPQKLTILRHVWKH